MPGGMLRSALAWSMAVTASLKAAPGARLKESVITGNCPWCVMVSGPDFVSQCVKALSGTDRALVRVEVAVVVPAVVIVVAPEVVPVPDVIPKVEGVM